MKYLLDSNVFIQVKNTTAVPLEPDQIIGLAVVWALGKHVPRRSGDVARRDPEPV